jgi:modulator of FtsH protease
MPRGDARHIRRAGRPLAQMGDFMAQSVAWTDFLVATAGATGALAGLVFVALSINLTRIIALPGVAGRAGETIIILAGALIGALLALIPGQPPEFIGVLFALLWLPVWGVPTAIQIQAIRRGNYYRLRYALVRFVLYQATTLPLLLAALSLMGYLAGGLSWFAVTVLLSLMVALLNAWVLLVEILR